jgi:carbon-monoxide dehydrogenase large subunit
MEDDRYMRGRGRFVADLRLPGMLDIAFVRSPLAHALLRGVRTPAGGRVFTAEDFSGVAGIRAESALAGFRSSVQPILATGKLRYVGEPIAACLAPTRAEAEDLAEQVQLDLEALPAVADMAHARDPAAPLVHEHWAENVFLETGVDIGFDAAVAGAAVTFHTELRTARQCMAPIEGRGVVAVWDNQAEQLVDHLHPAASHRAQRAGGVSWDGGGPHPCDRAGCGRRLRLQGRPADRGGVRRLPGYEAAASRALDRGSARASDRRRQLPGA